jgi:hypothetical protein
MDADVILLSPKKKVSSFFSFDQLGDLEMSLEDFLECSF